MCEVHQSPYIFVCLEKQCTNIRVGCEKCLIKLHHSHLSMYSIKQQLESCAFISDLEKNSEHKLYSSDPLDLELEDFINNKLITKERVNNIVDEIERSFLKDINDLKDELCKQESQKRILQSRKQKELIKLYDNIYQMKELRGLLKQFQQGQVKSDQVIQVNIQKINQKVNEIVLLRQESATKQLAKSVTQESIFQVQEQMIDLLKNVKYFFQKDESITFIKSQLSTEEDAQFLEIKAGKQFEFNEVDEVQLIYGISNFQKGVYEWQIKVEVLKKEEGQKEKGEGLDSIIGQGQPIFNQFGQHPIGGHLQNSGMFAAPEYESLGRLYIGIVEDSGKDQIHTYSLNYQTNQATAVDLIRGNNLGQFYSKQHQTTEKLDAIQNVFKKQIQNGIVLQFKLDLNLTKIYLEDAEKLFKYEGQISYMQTDQLRPFILAYKSRLRVTVC
ncbi:hypothetical protein pb186bvf_008526 [Paramecium bursaria]